MGDDPWNNVEQPDRKTEIEAERRAAESPHYYEFYRGKNSDGEYYLSFCGDFKIPSKSLISTANVSVLISPISKKKNQLRFILENPELKGLFRTLCIELISVSNEFSAGHDQTVADKMLKRFKRWIDLLAKAKSKFLSLNEQLGLIGELTFLLSLINTKLTLQDAVKAWRGPFGEEQDFILNKCLLEVKSQLASKDAVVKISSAAQLDTISGRIFICHKTFSNVSEGRAIGYSLNSIVNELRNVLRNEPDSVRDDFECALLELSYIENQHYDLNIFVQQKMEFYELTNGFPCIRGSDLPPEISSVSYSVNLDKCGGYLISEPDVMRNMTNG